MARKVPEATPKNRNAGRGALARLVRDAGRREDFEEAIIQLEDEGVDLHWVREILELYQERVGRLTSATRLRSAARPAAVREEARRLRLRQRLIADLTKARAVYARMATETRFFRGSTTTAPPHAITPQEHWPIYGAVETLLALLLPPGSAHLGGDPLGPLPFRMFTQSRRGRPESLVTRSRTAARQDLRRASVRADLIDTILAATTPTVP
jgi:hypothetical protein